MRLKNAEFLLLLLATMALVPGVAAQDNQDRAEGALFLLLPVGAQGVALGRAMTWVETTEGAFWNPAGLAGIDRSQALLIHGDHVAGTGTGVSALWAIGGGTLGASYFLLDAGDIDQTDEFGNPTGKITIRNHLGIASAATRLSRTVTAGVNFKVVRFQLSCRGLCADEGTTATTYAVDVGIQTLPMERLRVAAMVAHLGPSLQVVNADQADPLPARLRIAVAYNVLSQIVEADELKGWVAVEVEDRLRALGSMSVYLGTELTAGQGDALSLRAGYVWSELDQEDGGRVGLGLRYERFDLSIAKSLSVSTLGIESEPVHVTFSIGF
ncbi:MAG: PorV/PorQ family protein [Gemmatimonadetes bacterium]|nr:PorV/PorQ family protein [Gemmatimonadota bacterium]MDA1104338.1 PorV/PorQ family protein [Gemmatimonadota bacterium]